MPHRFPVMVATAVVVSFTLLACGHKNRPPSSSSSTGSSTGGAGGTGGEGGTGGAGECIEVWHCTPWETNGTSDTGQRTCTDANHCGTADNKPLEQVALPALDLEYFKCNVEPIFDRKCAMLGCHGTEQGRALRIYARGRKRLAGQTLANPRCGQGTTPSDGCDGSNQCLCAAPHTMTEWRKNYDAARGFALNAFGKPLSFATADASELLAQPVVKGEPHAGIHLFNKNDAEYTAIKNWVTGSKLGKPCDTGPN